MVIKMQNIWKKNTKLMLILLLDIFIISGATYAATTMYQSNIVGYDNTTSGLNSNNVQDALDEVYNAATDYSSLAARVTNLETNFLDKVYPIGSIFFSTSLSTVSQVATTLGGTWEVYGAGRTLIGVGTGTDSNSTSKTFAINETGGEYNHTLTTNEIPSHSHNLSNWVWVVSPGANSGNFYIPRQTDGIGNTNYSQTSMDTQWTGGNPTGGDQPHNNIQPYITVYMYKRLT